MQHDNMKIHMMSVKNHNLICSNKWSKTNHNGHKRLSNSWGKWKLVIYMNTTKIQLSATENIMYACFTISTINNNITLFSFLVNLDQNSY